MAFPLSRRRLAVLKTTLRNISPAIGSSHADEALAFALGFKTHASLLARLSGLDDVEIAAEFEPPRLIERLEQLGYGFASPVAQQISRLLSVAIINHEVMASLQDAAAHAANDNGTTIRE